MWDTILSTSWGFIGGLFAWFLVNFVGAEIVQISRLRREVRQHLHFFGNLSTYPKPQPFNDEEREASQLFRRKASEADALSKLRTRPTMIYLKLRGIDLEKAGPALTGFSNNITRTSRVIHRRWVESALALPYTDTYEYVKSVDDLIKQGRVE